MKKLTIEFSSCYHCPCLEYWPESGCRSYTPSHHSCMFSKIKDENAKDRLIATEDDVWDGEIPEWCEIDNAIIKDYDGWNH